MQWESDLSIEEIRRYSRQIILPKVKINGQQALSNAKVLIVGMGGLGSPVLMYLATTGIKTIGIVDFDKVELHNLQRQVIHKESNIGNYKTKSACEFVKSLNSTVNIKEHCLLLDTINVHDVIKDYDIIVDCCDSLPMRYILNDACRISKKDLICASVLRWEGQICVISKGNACYRCMFPDMKTSAPSCESSGVMGPVCGVIGSLQANEVVKLILKNEELNSSKLKKVDDLMILQDKELKTNTIDDNNELNSIDHIKDLNSIDHIKELNSIDHKNIGILVVFNCFTNSFKVLEKNYKTCSVCMTNEMGEIRVPEACEVLTGKTLPWQHILANLSKYALVDIRTNDQYGIFRVSGSFNIPEFEKNIDVIKALKKPVVMSCYKGKSSLAAAKFLDDLGIEAYSADRGIEGFKDFIGFQHN